ncbi:MAG: hypothetical protein K8T26_08780 [Lentisphaerae bacterium]|nr:hypothetical protein [Lentisphaerota bacterium]
MRRPICWTTRLEDRTKREVRVSITGRAMAWQFKCAGDEGWDRTSRPTAGDWQTLMDTAERWYTRRALTHENLVLIRRLHQEAQGRGEAG